MTAGDGAAAPGQAAYEAWWALYIKLDSDDSETEKPPAWESQPDDYRSAWAAAAQAAVTAAAAQPQDLRDLAAEAIAAYEAQISYDETPHDRSRIAGWRARLAAAAQPAPTMFATGELARFADDGQWLTCTEDGRLDLRAELLAVKAAVRAVLDLAAAPAAPAAAPGPRLVPLDPAVLHREVHRLSELLDEIGVMAANAPEDGDCFAVCEEIAMRVAAVDVPGEPEAGEAP